MSSPCDFQNKPLLTTLPIMLWAREIPNCSVRTQIMYTQNKFVHLKHDYNTNGPGFLNKKSPKLLASIHPDDITIKNINYKLPCVYNIHNKEIKQLILNGMSIKDTLLYIKTKYNIVIPYDILLFRTIEQRQYPTTGEHNIVPPNIGRFSKPFLLTQNVFIPSNQFTSIDFGLENNLLILLNQCKRVEVSNNDGKSHTSNINDLLPNNSASFWGSKIINTVNNNPVNNFRLPVLFTSIANQSIHFGFIIYNKLISNSLFFIPIILPARMLTYSPLPNNSPVYVTLVTVNQGLNRYSREESSNSEESCNYNPYSKLFNVLKL